MFYVTAVRNFLVYGYNEINESQLLITFMFLLSNVINKNLDLRNFILAVIGYAFCSHWIV